MNKFFKIISVILVAFIIAFFFFKTNHHDTQIPSLMSFEAYQATEHEVPYSFKLIKPDQCLFYFGSNHAHDPQDEQYPKLTELWHEFLHQTDGKKCIVIVEGGIRPVHPTKTQAIIKDGEAGYATFLAHQASIPCMSADPDDQYLETELRKKFSAYEIYFMRFTDVWHQFNERRKNGLKTNLKKYLQKFNGFLGHKNLKYFQNLYQQLFDEPFDVNNQTKIRNIINLKDHNHIIGKIHRQNNILRDEYIINQIQTLIDQGKNVFIVFGATHAVMQEPALTKIWNF